ncbi:DUF2188 domain-containing protein [Isoptericola variabilis]|uniref:Uncharacterized protein n=1 Tax=Isoptericola variabilis (strain 225) TaxID=743718 RepID=F6FVX5_ISOV2|nr:DUF2188 domain-containing protein [Isoptericola variabilis]AEG44445.1 hypothetical protein Isova_1693 [Isoptericola variabilis 225]TWH28283.1 uncharacterized protein DUF2188 [Isoptericola variabilis J7]
MTDSTAKPAGVPDDDVHTAPRDGAWVNEVLGHVVGGSFASLEEAVAAGREEARRRGVEHRVDDESAVWGTSDAGGFVERPDTGDLR